MKIKIDGQYKQPSLYSNIVVEIITKIKWNDLILYETSYKCLNLSLITNNDSNFNISFDGIEKDIINE